MTIDEAIHHLRGDPACAELVRDAYLGRDVTESAERFRRSAEFEAVVQLVSGKLRGATVLDVGAGTGIASHAFLSAGAARAIAVEPDPSEEVGRGAIRRLDPQGGIEILDAFGEDLPLEDRSVDIVYARQLLHHAEDLPRLVAECARVLKPGGLFIACREHVVKSDGELLKFRASHPIHKLAGGENAYRLKEYEAAITGEGLNLVQTLGPLDSVINAFPLIGSHAELMHFAQVVLGQRLGLTGRVLGRIPGVSWLVRHAVESAPGRLYTFVAAKPDGP